MKAKLITKTIQSLTPGSKAYDVRDTDLLGFILRVTPAGRMNYFCDFRRPDGRRTRIKLGDTTVLTPAQARDEALKILGEVARGHDPSAIKRATRQDTLDDFIEKHYKPWVETHRKTGKQTVSRALARFSEFQHERLPDLSPWKIEKWRSARLKAGIAPATVNRNITMLKAILQKAVEWGVIEANPLTKIRPLKTDHSAKVRFLDEAEERALRIALDQRENRIRSERKSHNEWALKRGYPMLQDLSQIPFADHLKPMILISINTGLRRGELFNLRWSNVDLQRRVITVTGATAKSGKTRHIPLNNEATQTFRDWKSTSNNNSDLVFVGRLGGVFDNTRKSWEGVLKAANIQNFRWHDLRHHFASKLVLNSVDLNTVRELLGHGDLKMTLRYAHLAPQAKAEAVAKLDIGYSSSLSMINQLDIADNPIGA